MEILAVADPRNTSWGHSPHSLSAPPNQSTITAEISENPQTFWKTLCFFTICCLQEIFFFFYMEASLKENFFHPCIFDHVYVSRVSSVGGLGYTSMSAWQT